MPTTTHLPEYENFATTMETAGLVPVYRKIISDLDTPLTLFAKIAGDEDHIFLFESMEGGEKWGRYSFIGYDPILTFSSIGSQIDIQSFAEELSTQVQPGDNPLVALQSLLESFKAAENPDLPRFSGGAVGFLGYDMVRFMEELPSDKELLDFPDSSFMVPRIVLVHDSFKQTVTVVCWVPENAKIQNRQLYNDAVAKIDSVVELLRAPVPVSFIKSSCHGSRTEHQFKSNMEKTEFCAMVERAREYIKSGDIIQVVLSQRFHTKTDLNALDLYRALRHINPSPYLFFIKLGSLVQIGSSPEILVRKEDDLIELRPIAGTRKRGNTKVEDRALEKDCWQTQKNGRNTLCL